MVLRNTSVLGDINTIETQLLQWSRSSELKYVLPGDELDCQSLRLTTMLVNNGAYHPHPYQTVELVDDDHVVLASMKLLGYAESSPVDEHRIRLTAQV